MGEVKFLFFKSFLLGLTKYSIWRVVWALGYHSMGIGYSPGISQFPGVLHISLSRSAIGKVTCIYHVHK